MAAAVPDDNSNPYALISERNVFHLNPIPDPPPPQDTPKVDLPVIKLSGFLRIGKTTHALFSYSPKDSKLGPMYYDLANGEKDGILEVVTIHEDRGEVEIINSGTPLTLSLKNDTLEIKAAAPVKSANADVESLRRLRSAGAPGEVPGRAAYRFPVPSQPGIGNSSPAFPMPSRRTRVPE
jgi:hypothetical protein